jgi:hypothetical protein
VTPVLLVELLDDPTIISIVGVTLVEDVVIASSTLVTLGAVPTMVLQVGLRREDNILLVLGVLRLVLWEMRLQQIMHEEPPFFGLGAPVSKHDKGGRARPGPWRSFMDNFSFILMSVTPVENAEMTSSLEIRGILFLIWLKR